MQNRSKNYPSFQDTFFKEVHFEHKETYHFNNPKINNVIRVVYKNFIVLLNWLFALSVVTIEKISIDLTLLF